MSGDSSIFDDVKRITFRRGTSETALLVRQKAFDYHLERLSNESRCDSLTSHSDCRRKLNKIRRHAQEQLAPFKSDDGFLELSKLSEKDKQLLIQCISESQLDAFIDAFEAFDFDSDSSISGPELRVVLKSLALSVSFVAAHFRSHWLTNNTPAKVFCRLTPTGKDIG
eukprot:sb/3472344/